MSFLAGFLEHLQGDLGGRPDAGRVAQELGAVATRIAGGVGRGDAVLDLGSGTGAVAVAAADRGATVVAIDVEDAGLRRGRDIALGVGAPIAHVAGDARALPFRDAVFDGSVHRSVLVYMRAREKAVAEERRALRPGGWVSCSESLGAELDLRVADESILRVWRGGLGQILSETASFRLSAGDLAGLYREAGFEQVTVDRVPVRVPLDSAGAIARAFVDTPPAGVSARTLWERSAVPGPLVDEFLARLDLQARGGTPAELLAAEGFLTARAPA